MSHDGVKFMRRAIELAVLGVRRGDGGPFGCVVVKNDEVVGEGNNRVTSTNDPTAHAEVVAIRDACNNLKTFQLEGCEIYTSCEPCPMCLGAIMWARPAAVYYAGTREDAAASGFDDAEFYAQFEVPNDKKNPPLINFLRESADEAFAVWLDNADRIDY